MLDVSAPVIKSRAAAEAERQQLIKDAEAALADYIASLEAEGKEIPEGLNADQFMANPNPDAAVVNAVSFENETITYYGGWTSLAVKKVWVLDDGGEAADSVTVNLLRNGKVYETLSLSAADGWSKTWSLLDDSYTWTVEEVNVPEGFTSAISRSGLTFTIVNDDKDGGGNDENGGNDGNGGTGGDGGGERSGGDGGQNQDRGDGGEELVIIEEDVPLANVPRTGSNLTSELICIASGLALAVLLLAGKRKRTE